MTNKTLLLFCDFYLPGFKAGGPVRSISAIVDALKNDFDITIVTRDHDLVTFTSYENITSDTINQREDYRVLYLSEKNILKGIYQHAKNHAYDIVYFNSYVSPKFAVFPLTLIKLRILKTTRIVISPRGELGDGALSIKPIRKKTFVALYRYLFPFKQIEWLSSSGNEKKDIQNRFGGNTRITVLENINSTKPISQIINNKERGQLKIVFLSRISKKKNLHYALQVLMHLKGNIIFDIYGPIHDPSYWSDCEFLIKKLPAPVRVNYYGDLPYELVSETLSHYDLFFLPTLNENYGHVIVEALAAACPVLLSDQTPWHDIAEKKAGWHFSLSQQDQFIQQLNEILEMDDALFLTYKKAALDYFCRFITNDKISSKYRLFFIKNNYAHFVDMPH